MTVWMALKRGPGLLLSMISWLGFLADSQSSALTSCSSQGKFYANAVLGKADC